MDRKVRDQKLDSLARCLLRIEDNMPRDVDHLKADVNLQDILILNLERLVQISVDAGISIILEKSWGPVPDSMAGVFTLLGSRKALSQELVEKLKKSVGFRNVCVHEYDKISWDIVYEIVTTHLGTFREFARIIDAL